METTNTTPNEQVTRASRAKQNTVQEIKEVSIDASGRRLGRLASEIAVLLQGKNRADYAPNLSGSTIVTIENIDNLEVTDAKKQDKMYQNFSGYPGGLKTQNMNAIIAKKGMAEILRSAVRGMLPKNKLQKIRMGNLIISETNSQEK